MEVQDRRWWVEALRAGVLLNPRVLPAEPGARLVVGVLAGLSLVYVAATRAMVSGPAAFNYQLWLGTWWATGLVFLAAWALYVSAPGSPRGGRPVARWFVFGLVASVPASLAGIGFGAVAMRNELDWPAATQWSVFVLFCLWGVGVNWQVARTLLPRGRAATLAGLSLAVVVAMSWLTPQTAWYSTAPAKESGDEEEARLRLDQETFEQQQMLLGEQLAKLPAHRRGGPAQVWGIVFAPYAGENVFLNESTMVADVLAQRFDASGRVVQLVNHRKTLKTHAWATPLNLQRTIGTIAARMDKDKDVLVVYLTSHGGRDLKLSAWHWPLQVEPMTPASLRAMLDESGIKYRVLAISACYSGGWVDPLASDATLVMTAADADHTSYGCGRKSELTYFGRAMFDEQLRSKTRSFEEAFASAVPVIREREQKAGKSDGFSNPQLRAGVAIKPVLADLQSRLDQADARK